LFYIIHNIPIYLKKNEDKLKIKKKKKLIKKLHNRPKHTKQAADDFNNLFIHNFLLLNAENLEQNAQNLIDSKDKLNGMILFVDRFVLC
jgi:hypothetical protein